MAVSLGVQIAWLFVLALPIACVAWTLTHEEIFREPREYCAARSQQCQKLVQRKFYYVFTCEYCLSHYATVGFLFLTRYHLLLPDWRGYVIAGFSLVWIANFYMAVFARLRLEIKGELLEVKQEERQLAEDASVSSTRATRHAPIPTGTARGRTRS